MRSFSKSKFSQCFCPVGDLDAMLEPKVSAHHSKNKHTVLKVIKAMVLETILVSLIILFFYGVYELNSFHFYSTMFLIINF